MKRITVRMLLAAGLFLLFPLSGSVLAAPDGQVSSVSLISRTDGTAPFDADDASGNDSSDNNGIVRSFDTVLYNLSLSMQAASSVSIDFTAEMDADASWAQFDLDQMVWASQGGWSVDFLDADGVRLYERRSDGVLYTDAGVKTNLNQIILGSDQGTDSYRTSPDARVVTQRFKASYTVDTGSASWISFDKALSLGIAVKAAPDGTQIPVRVSAGITAGASDPVTLDLGVLAVSAKLSVITGAGGASAECTGAASWYDFQTGQEVSDADIIDRLNALAELNPDVSDPSQFSGATDAEKERFQYIRYARPTAAAAALYIGNENGAASGKGMKGLALPQGSASFTFSTSASSSASGVEAYIWDAMPGAAYTSRTRSYQDEYGTVHTEYYNAAGLLGRTNTTGTSVYNLQGVGIHSYYNITLASRNAQSVYSGGVFSFSDDPVSASPFFSSAVLQADGYTFDFDQWHFPSIRLNGAVHEQADDGLYAFASANFKIMTVYPKVRTSGASSYTLKTSASDFSCDAAPAWSNSLSTSKDWSFFISTTGNRSIWYMTAQNAFTNHAQWVTAWDGRAEAGSSGFIRTRFGVGSAGDGTVRAVDKLILLDDCIDYPQTLYVSISSNSASLDSSNTHLGAPEKLSDAYGELTAVFAVDPDMPEGFDSSTQAGYDHMFGKSLDHFQYYAKKSDIPEGYSACGILISSRNSNFKANQYLELRVPIVYKEGTAGKISMLTVTENLIFDTSAADLYWTDAVWDTSAGKNVLAGYPSKTYSNGTGSITRALVSKPASKLSYTDGVPSYIPSSAGMAGINYCALVSSIPKTGLSFSGAVYDMDAGITTASGTLTGWQTASATSTRGTGWGSWGLIDLDVTVKIDTGSDASRTNGVLYRQGHTTITDKNGTVKTISYNKDSPTSVDWTDRSGNAVSFTVWIEPAADLRSFVIHAENIPEGKDLPDISFECSLGSDVKNNETITCSASAVIPGEDIYLSSLYSIPNYAEASFQAVSQAAARASLASSATAIDTNGMVSQTVTYTNVSGSDGTLYIYLKTPSSGFKGTVLTADASASSGTVWYSRSLAGVSPSEAEADGNLSYLKTLIQMEYTQDAQADAESMYLVAPFSGLSTVSFTVTYQTDGNSAGDLYDFEAEVYLSSSSGVITTNQTQVRAVGRALSGMIFKDLDADGLYTEGVDAPAQGASLTLLSLSDGIYSDTGTTVLSGEDGMYSFEDIAPGVYAVGCIWNPDGESAPTVYTEGGSLLLEGSSDFDGIIVPDGEGSGVTLYAASEMAANNVSLSSYAQRASGLDAGYLYSSPAELIADMPSSGMSGMTGFLYLGAAVLILSAVSLQAYFKKMTHLIQ